MSNRPATPGGPPAGGVPTDIIRVVGPGNNHVADTAAVIEPTLRGARLWARLLGVDQGDRGRCRRGPAGRRRLGRTLGRAGPGRLSRAVGRTCRRASVRVSVGRIRGTPQKCCEPDRADDSGTAGDGRVEARALVTTRHSSDNCLVSSGAVSRARRRLPGSRRLASRHTGRARGCESGRVRSGRSKGPTEP